MNWIKCSDKMPPFHEDVLVCVDEDGYWDYDVGYINEARKEWSLKSGIYDIYEVSHWAILPEKPQRVGL